MILDPSIAHKPISDLWFEALCELTVPPPQVPLVNFPLLSKSIGGLRLFEYTVLCGATGTGKTTMLANLSHGLMLSKVPHFVASVETGHFDFVRRVISAAERRNLNSGDVVPLADVFKIKARQAELIKASQSYLSLYDDRISSAELIKEIEHMVVNKGCKVVMLDNINFFMEVTKVEQSIVEMDRVVHELIILAKRLPVHIIMVAHPKKTDHGRVESEFDVKGSSLHVQEAHNVLLLNRPHPDATEQGISREIKLAKVRRMGKYVGQRIGIKAIDGVTYIEGNRYDIKAKEISRNSRGY